jgi:tRNA A-37 threonylcarbamoyl transferase component Bud32/tetratricopeptide (TPR) repeat protein
VLVPVIAARRRGNCHPARRKIGGDVVKADVEKIFHSVVDLSTQDRARYFAEHPIDENTRGEVERLLAFDSGATTMLEAEIGQIALGAMARLEPRGHACGPYRLEHLIGHGGMGSVYSAERVDGEVTQRVAVKLLRPGADDPQLRMRFLGERQILARVSHPNIARLLDAGHREDGQPYLVMERVDGKPIDVYAAGLGTRRKITLFLKVCAAVSYLHKHLIVHRDFKPANILVTNDGEPKLLDFGIAKLLDLTTDSTSTALRMLTPDYASPEQVAGGPITTATDVYLLGAVLYKLLTGVSPHQFEDTSAGAVIAAITSGRVTPPSKRAPGLNADLESIVMKALRKEPQDRYTSADALAEDLRAWLEWRPVQARSGAVWYRTRRLLRRHWAFATATALVIASLSTGLYLAHRQTVVAERRFAQLRQLSNRVLDLDRSISQLPGSIEARQRLVAVSLDYLEGLDREAQGNLDLQQEIGRGYWRLARIQGGNSEFNLGESAKAELSLKKADALVDNVLASRPHDRATRIRSAIIAHDRTIVAYAEERRADLVTYLHKAVKQLEAFERSSDGGHPLRLDTLYQAGDPRSERSGLGGMYVNLAIMALNARMYDEGARLAQHAVALTQSISGGQSLLCESFSVLANALRFQGDLDGALAAIHQARQASEQATYPTPVARLFNLYGPILREGRILGEEDSVNLGRPAEGVGLLQKALDITEEVARKDPAEVASRIRLGGAAWSLGDILRDRDPRRALAVYDLGILRLGEAQASVQARRDRAVLIANSSYPLRRLHRNTEAKARLESALAILKETNDYPVERIQLDSHAEAMATALADQEAAAGNSRRALEIYDDLLNRIIAGGPKPDVSLPDATSLSRIYGTLASLCRRTGLNDRAANLEARRLSLWRYWDTRLPHNTFVTRQLETANSGSASTN